MEAFRKIYPSEFYRKFLVHGVRPDGRDLNKIRKTKISVGSLGGSDGSSFVRLASTNTEGTTVTCGIVAEVGEPTNKTPNGQIVVNVELTPLCSTRFRSGKPSEQAQVLGVFLNQVINSSSFVRLDELKVDVEQEEGAEALNLVWYLYVDIYCLNYDGNVEDACLISLVSALKNVRFPKLNATKEGQLVSLPLSVGSTLLPLQIDQCPVSLTFAVVDEFIIADPTSEEEELSNGSFTIMYNSKGRLLSVVKSGGVAVSEDTLKQCMEKTKQRVEQVVKQIQSIDSKVQQ